MQCCWSPVADWQEQPATCTLMLVGAGSRAAWRGFVQLLLDRGGLRHDPCLRAVLPQPSVVCRQLRCSATGGDGWLCVVDAQAAPGTVGAGKEWTRGASQERVTMAALVRRSAAHKVGARMAQSTTCTGTQWRRLPCEPDPCSSNSLETHARTLQPKASLYCGWLSYAHALRTRWIGQEGVTIKQMKGYPSARGAGMCNRQGSGSKQRRGKWQQ